MNRVLALPEPGRATLQFNLPVPAYVGGNSGLVATVGSWQYRQNSPTLYHYSGTLNAYSPTGLSASFNGAWDGTAPRSRLGAGSTPILTVGAADVLSATGQYLAA